MQLIPIKTPLIKEGDDLAAILTDQVKLEEDDILIVSSKAIAMAEGAVIDLKKIEITDEGKKWAEKIGRTPEFRQAVINEANRLNGTVCGSCPNAMLTDIKPDGLEGNGILVANAGLDQSNIDDGYAIGWPHDPLASTVKLQKDLINKSGKKIAVILTDSCCRPRRLGLTALALTVSGIEPFENHRGKPDLFGKELKMTSEAVADQLATAGNMLMGNADQSIPAVIARDHSFKLSGFSGWVPGINKEEDLFNGVL